MKKALSLFIALLFVLSLLAGCSGSCINKPFY